MKTTLFLVLAALLVHVLAGCASADEDAVRQVVIQAECAAEDALNGNAKLGAVKQYFATPLESGNTDPMMDRRIAFSAVVGRSRNGSVRLSKFQINSITIWPQVNEARLQYQVDTTITYNVIPQTETVTQSLLLTKTLARGWRIMGSNGAETTSGDASFLASLGGQ